MAAVALDGERKTVTALFADIKGSMELMEDLDPEDARAIVDPALRLMMEAARRYGGYVAQSTGDGIFAVFGAPVAHEDHPQRALYAALRMQEDFRHYSDQLRSSGQPPIQVRVGVNTGEVVVRTIHTDQSHTEYTPIGHSTGLASRMQALAPVGSIAATEGTRRLCEGYFTFRSLGATKVKGVTEPVAVFEVTGLGPLRTRLQRAAGRGLTKFVGRQREMESLEHAARLAQAGQGQIVAAVAEAGVGKSRLFFEFKVRNESGWTVLESYSVSHGKASAYLPLIDLLQGYFRISDEDDERTRREKIAGRLAILDPALEEVRPYLFALLGIAQPAGDSRHWEQSLDRLEDYLREFQKKDHLAQMDGQIRRRRTLDAVKRIVLRESLHRPVMLILEDLHWIDEETQAFLDLLADSIASSRVLMLVNYRPEYQHSWSNKTYYSQLRLDPLGRESADQLLGALLGGEAGLASLRGLIVEKTEGNPFFIEEIVQALIEDGSLHRNGTVRLTRPLDTLAIPATVQAILASRIDRLPPAEKDLLQTLAVIGKDFPLRLARAVWEADSAHQRWADGEDRLASMLDDLQTAEFIYEQPAAGDLEYTFKHALTQEVTYRSVLQERRKRLHGQIASAIETVYRDGIEDHLGELARHFGRSSGGARAIDYLWRAANQASQRALYSEAAEYVKRGLELVSSVANPDERAREELRLQMVLGSALMAARGFSSGEVEACFTRCCELARSLGDADKLFFALAGLCGFYITRGEAQAAGRTAQESMTVARELDDEMALKYAYYFLGAALQATGDLRGARDQFESAVALKGEGKVHEQAFFGPDAAVLSLTSLSDVLFVLGYPDQALRRSYEALNAVSRNADPFSYAMAMNFVILAHCGRREGARAEELCRELAKLSTDHGFPFWLASADRLEGYALLLQGRAEEGIALMERQTEQGEAPDGEAGLAQYNLLPLMAAVYGRLGRCKDGFATLERWRELCSSRSTLDMSLTALRIRGELFAREGSIAEAEQDLRQTIELSLKHGARMEQLRAATSLARLLARRDLREQARTMLEEAYGWFTEGFDTADLKDAKTLIDELS